MQRRSRLDAGLSNARLSVEGFGKVLVLREDGVLEVVGELSATGDHAEVWVYYEQGAVQRCPVPQDTPRVLMPLLQDGLPTLVELRVGDARWKKEIGNPPVRVTFP